MTSLPGFRAGCHVTVLPGDGVYLLAERGAVVLRGAVHEHLAPLLDGTRSPDALVDALTGIAPAAEVYYALDQLIRRGYVTEITPPASMNGPSRAAAGFWSALGLDALDITTRLRTSTVSVHAVGRANGAAMTAALGDVGVTVSPVASLTVVVTDDYLHPDVARLTGEAHVTGRPHMLCKPYGTMLWIGPHICPGATACWECLAQRLRLQRTIDDYVQARTPDIAPLVIPPAALPCTEQIGLVLTALEVAKLLGSTRDHGMDNQLVALDLRSLDLTHHTIVRRPQCSRCGDAPSPDRTATRPQLRHAAAGVAGADDDGRRRRLPPEATFARLKHHISPVTGLLDEVRPAHPAPDSPSGIHVYRVGTGQAWAWGKGTTRAQARTSALCEALETASGRWHGDEPRVRDCYRALGDRAIHPNACMLFSERQYAERERWNATSGQLRKIPEPFDEDAEMDWSPLWSLTHDVVRLLPSEYSYYGHPARPVRCVADPNGHGAGASLEEAIAHALLELVERDAVALWWLTMARRPAVDLDSFDDPFVREVRGHADQHERVIDVLDLTTDFGIPVFAASSRSVVAGKEQISFGFGSDFDPGVALVRALTEMEQLACTLPLAKDPWFRRWWRDASVADHPYLIPDASLPAYRRRHAVAPAPMDALDAILECRRRLEPQGLEVLVLDQTRPDIGLPAVHVVVPGLRHWRPPRTGPGRLYDVPHRLGWVTRPLREDQLNPRFLPA